MVDLEFIQPQHERWRIDDSREARCIVRSGSERVVHAVIPVQKLPDVIRAVQVHFVIIRYAGTNQIARAIISVSRCDNITAISGFNQTVGFVTGE